MALALFALIMLFLDSFSVLKLIDRKSELKELRDQKEFYEEGIVQIEEDAAAFENDPAALEKFAREEYRMKKDDEDVFVIVEEDK